MLTSMISVRPRPRESPEVIELGVTTLIAAGIVGALLSKQRSSSTKSLSSTTSRDGRRRGRLVEIARVFRLDSRLLTDMGEFLSKGWALPMACKSSEAHAP